MFEKTYAYEFGELGPRKMSSETMQNIGIIIRTFSDIEEFLTLIITQDLKITELKVHILLGRLIISKKINKIQSLLALDGKDEKFSRVFDSEFSNLLKIRNVLAHGFYLGPAEVDGQTAHIFRTSDLKEIGGDEEAISEVYGLSDGLISNAVKEILAYSEKIIEEFELVPLLKNTVQRDLVRHKKARKPRRRGETRAPQPQS